MDTEGLKVDFDKYVIVGELAKANDKALKIRG